MDFSRVALTCISFLAFRDRDAGSANNRGKPIDDGQRSDRHSHQDRGPGGRGRDYEPRGERGGRGNARGGRGAPGDRHTRGLPKYDSFLLPPAANLP